MPAPISSDVRERVVAAYEAGEGGYGTIGKRFKVDPKTVRRWVKMRITKGHLAPAVHRGSVPPLISAADLPKIMRMVEIKSDLSAEMLAKQWNSETGNNVSRSTMVRALQRLGLTWKKKPFERPSRVEKTSRTPEPSFGPR